MEQAVANMKRVGIQSNSLFGYEFAAVVSDGANAIRHTIFTKVGKDMPRDYNISRSIIPLEDSIDMCDSISCKLPSLMKIENNDVVYTLNNKKALFIDSARKDTLTLLLSGLKNLENYVQSLFNENPKTVTLRSQMTLKQLEKLRNSQTYTTEHTNEDDTVDNSLP